MSGILGGIYFFVILFFGLSYFVIYGVPFVSMLLFLMIGQQIGLEGALVKFFLLYWSRYVGLFAHLLSLLFSTYLA